MSARRKAAGTTTEDSGACPAAQAGQAPAVISGPTAEEGRKAAGRGIS
ncbi:hypothetical protein ABZU45_33635 [Streptomyces avermitilis]